MAATRSSVSTDLTVWILLVAAIAWLALHGFVGDRVVQQLGRNYDSSRIWRPEDPPRSQENLLLEQRLNKDLDAFEKAHSTQHINNTLWNRTFWQTWKNDGLLNWRQSWISLNPTWQYNFLTDDEAYRLVKDIFQQVPDVLETWAAYPKNVLRFDLFRYLIPYALGGLYADADTTCLIPIDNWLSQAQWDSHAIHSVIGLEYDGPHARLSWSRAVDFVQYVMLGKAYSPIFRHAIIESIVRSHRLKEYQRVESLAKTEWSFGMVLATTGPRTFTDACLSVIKWDDPLLQMEDDIWRKSYAISGPRQIGGAVVLPPASWLRGASGIPKNFLHHGQGSWIE